MLIYVWFFSDANHIPANQQKESCLVTLLVNQKQSSFSKFYKEVMVKMSHSNCCVVFCVVSCSWTRWNQHVWLLCRSSRSKHWCPDGAEVQCVRSVLHILLLLCAFSHLHPFASLSRWSPVGTHQTTDTMGSQHTASMLPHRARDAHGTWHHSSKSTAVLLPIRNTSNL